MKNLWAPWRIEYVKNKKEKGCIFCKKPKLDDREGLILFRGKTSTILMNLYPYNNGHLLISPLRHIDTFTDMLQNEKIEILDLIDHSMNSLSKIMKPEGFNIGANIGESAGAGIKDHIHFHVVPRWGGDSNFMPVLGETKVQVEGLEDSWEELYPIFKERIDA